MKWMSRNDEETAVEMGGRCRCLRLGGTRSELHEERKTVNRENCIIITLVSISQEQLICRESTRGSHCSRDIPAGWQDYCYGCYD